MAAEVTNLWALSGVNNRHEPFVQLRKNEQSIAQLTPAEARQFAQQITEAAEAAETDAFLMHFLREKVGMTSLEVVGRVLLEFRQYREAHGGQAAPKEADFAGKEFAAQRAAAINPTGNKSQE